MYNDELFTPGIVDEQVDELSSLTRDESLLPNAKVIQRLHALYEEDKRSTERVWLRLERQVSELDSDARRLELLHALQPERIQQMQQLSHISQHPRKSSSFQRYLGQLVAALLMVALVGSLLTVLHLARQQSSRSASAPQDSLKPGHIVYSTPLENGWVSGLAWSFDGQRVVIVGSQTQIWDATTGQHKVTLRLNPSPIAGPAWSPKSDLLAIPTSDSVVIVNGQSGKIIASYPAPTTASASTGSPSTGGYLSAFLPYGGAPNFGGIVWSPDGKWIASTFSSATSDGLVQVWNPLTGKLAFNLAKEPGFFVGAISWSPDGKYIAVNMSKWNGNLLDQLNVWSVTTHQIVFQQSGNKLFEGSTWQPGTDNLASAFLTDNVYNTAVLNIWNVKTRHLIKSFPGIDAISSWSPNGQQFVYSPVGSSAERAGVTILDVNTGRKVYTFQVSDPAAQLLSLSGAWSPNGKYIVSVESIHSSETPGSSYQGAYKVVVWVAY